MDKKEILILIAILVLLAGFFVFYKSSNPESADIRKFTGTIVSVEEQTVTLHGVFLADIIPEDFREPRDFSFQIDANTVFTKKEIYWDWEEIKKENKNSGSDIVDLKDLPMMESEGSLNDIQSIPSSDLNNIRVEVDFPYSVSDREDSVASSVFYEIIVDY
jgi:regulator of protease activity HflC (stomatin/prohibitin superfamily)